MSKHTIELPDTLVARLERLALEGVFSDHLDEHHERATWAGLVRLAAAMLVRSACDDLPEPQIPLLPHAMHERAGTGGSPPAAAAARQSLIDHVLRLRAAIVDARRIIDDAGPHEDPMCAVVEVLDHALDATRVLVQQRGNHDDARRQLEQVLLLIDGDESQNDLAAKVRGAIDVLAILGVHRA